METGRKRTYDVRNTNGDYGIYENGMLRLVLNSARNAELIVNVLQMDATGTYISGAVLTMRY